MHTTDAGSPDAGAGPVCSFQATGAALAHGTCNLRVQSKAHTDGAPSGEAFALTGSSEIVRFSAWLRFLGAPLSGVATRGSYSSGAQPFVGEGVVVDQRGIEWFGKAGIQGTFRLTLTSVRRLPVEGGASLELHGTLELELPPANLIPKHPNSRPHPLLTLRVTF